MSSSRVPYFPFYPDDFSSSPEVEAMTVEEVGAYMLLLCKCWRAIPMAELPNNDEQLARWARQTPQRWAKIKPKVMAAFHLDKKRKVWISKLLKPLYKKFMAKRKERQKSGKRGAETVWRKRLKVKGSSSSAIAQPRLSHSSAQAKPQLSHGSTEYRVQSTATTTPTTTPKATPNPTAKIFPPAILSPTPLESVARGGIYNGEKIGEEISADTQRPKIPDDAALDSENQDLFGEAMELTGSKHVTEYWRQHVRDFGAWGQNSFGEAVGTLRYELHKPDSDVKNPGGFFRGILGKMREEKLAEASR